MVEPVLKVEGLTIAARVDGHIGPSVVDDISFEIGAGQSIGLIGESGSGKSTIGLALLGHFRPGLRPVSGSITFMGQDILKLPEADRRALRGNRISYVAQSAAAAFNPAHRLGEQVIEAVIEKRKLGRRQALERAEELFTLLGLPDPAGFMQRYPHQASGGQLQRVMTAMALCPHPDLIVFDEPTTALDVTTQAEVLLAIRRAIAVTGVSTLFISHDLPVVAQIANRILVLQRGRTVETGSTETILKHPRQDYTRRLIAARSMPAQTDPGGAQEPVLEIVDVSANYRNAHHVLHRVSLSVPAGRTLAVVGQSGSGKTTLGRVVTGAHPLAAGSIRFRGTPLAPGFAQRQAEHTRRIQMIHQMPEMALNPRQRLKDIIGRPLALFRGLKGGELKDAIAELMTAVDLDPSLGSRFPGAVSGGQKQRVCIARALAANPDLIICDEPTSALDPIVARSVLELLSRLQESRGLSLMFITHDFNVVKAVAHTVAVLDAGRVVCTGPATEVLTPPFDDRIGRLLQAVPDLDPGWLSRWSASDGSWEGQERSKYAVGA